MPRYWHPHATETRYLEDWDAFWDQHRSGFVVKITDPEFGDDPLCTCRDSDRARRVAACVNKANAFDRFVQVLRQGASREQLNEMLAFVDTNQDDVK